MILLLSWLLSLSKAYAVALQVFGRAAFEVHGKYFQALRISSEAEGKHKQVCKRPATTKLVPTLLCWLVQPRQLKGVKCQADLYILGTATINCLYRLYSVL
jgi:hypothetical protein